MTNQLLVGCAAAALLALGAVPATAAQAPSPEAAAAASDPAVRQGVLANGLRYAIVRNATPRGSVTMRLAFDVGSYDEAEEERGAAHFVEHMAFRSTANFPDGALERAFAPHGIAWGRDQNATTSLNETAYSIDLPEQGKSQRGAALRWLRDVADGIRFGAEAVNVERGVVQAEKRSRSNAVSAVEEDFVRFQGPERRSLNRNPIGTDRTLAALTPAQLEAFYARWYRPENAVLVIAGDIEPDEIEAQIAAGFGDWRGRGAAGVRAPAAKGKPRAVDAFARADPAFPNIVNVCRISDAEPDAATPLAHAVRDAEDAVWQELLTQRFDRMAAGAKDKLLGVKVAFEPAMRDARAACMFVVPNGTAWQPALAAAQAELRRFERDGPTEAELEKAVETVRSRHRAAVAQAQTRSSPMLASAIAGALLQQRPVQSPAQAMRTFDHAVEGIAPEAAKAAFAADWTGTEPLLMMLGTETVEPAALIAAWRAGEAAEPLPAYTERARVAFAYDSFGPPGQVVKREAFPERGFVRLHFANGTVLHHKKTDFGVGGAHVVVSFGEGRMEVGNRDYLPATLAAATLADGGLGRMSREEIGAAFPNDNWQFALSVDERSYNFSAGVAAGYVPSELKLLAAFMSDPGFRNEIDPQIPAVVDLVYKITDTDPVAVAAESLEAELFPNGPRKPPKDQLAGLRSADFERLLKPALTQSPVEVAVIGDIEEEAAIRAVAASFGALPARPPVSRRKPVDYNRYPDTPPAKAVTGRHAGPPDKAAFVMAWPLYVASPERRREEYAIQVLANLFDATLRQRIRGAMGKTYAPRVETEMPDFADQGVLIAAVETSPADLEAAITAAAETAAALAAGDITPEAFEAARQPLLAQRAELMRANAAWAAVLAGSAREPVQVEELFDFDPLVRALTLDELKRVAATWLARKPFVSKALPQASGGGKAR